MNKYKSLEELKEELGDNFEEYMYKANRDILEANQRLQEAKDSLQNDYQEAVDKINELQDRIDKAISYLKKFDGYSDNIEIKKIINLLQGDDKE